MFISNNNDPAARKNTTAPPTKRSQTNIINLTTPSVNGAAVDSSPKGAESVGACIQWYMKVDGVCPDSSVQPHSAKRAIGASTLCVGAR